MPKRKLVKRAAGIALLLVAVCGILLWYQIRHLRIEVPKEQVADAEVALKGSLGQVLFAGRGGDLSSDHEGLIAAYQKNPREFARYARMYDTAMNAKKVAQVVVQFPESKLPPDSSLLSMDSNERVDAWGSPFCLISTKGKLAVVSGGPAKIRCDALPLTPEQIGDSTRTIFSAPSDVVVVINSYE